jgi:predicted transposase YbfD/YdcC
MHKQTEKKIGQKSLREEKFNRFVSKNKDFLDSIKLSKGTLPDQITKFFLVANFTNIVDMTFDILDKSDMDRELKLELFAAISKVNWSYREDFQTGIELPVNNYFEQVQEVLLQALSN